MLRFVEGIPRVYLKIASPFAYTYHLSSSLLLSVTLYSMACIH